MGDLDKNIEGQGKQSRVIWLDPNKSNNKMVNPDDLTINVEFSTVRKGRSIVISGERFESTENSSNVINFIEGSKVSENSENRSLTTRYTNAISLDLMNPSGDDQSDGFYDDYESLGIESIDIEFNTAYTPIIKIKFIDVRGNAILSQGNSSKYKMFFELPYPLFKLKIKGFYGKAVTYCLHLQRWNANFNSETGNFEIQADFIGYTYAFLTDMLIGLVRATSFTDKGRRKLEEKRKTYKDESLIITIDEMLEQIVNFNNTFNKIKENDDDVKSLNKLDDSLDKLKTISEEVSRFIDVFDGDNPPFKNDTILVTNDNEDEDKEKSYLEFKKNLSSYIEEYNNILPSKLSSLKIDTKIDSLILKTKGITKSELNKEASSDNPKFIIKTEGNRLLPHFIKENIDIANSIISEIKLNNDISNDVSFNVYSFNLLLEKIKIKKNEIGEYKDDITEKVVITLSDSIEEQLGFNPTIRNIFRVLAVNTEVFLEVLRDVSIASQNNPIRDKEIKKLIPNSGNGDASEVPLNINPSHINKVIYPWPEYREQDKNQVFVETYMGSNENITPQNIDELRFTEELLRGFVDVVRSDDNISRLEEVLNADGDIDKIDTNVKEKWWPVSTADLPLGNININKNPYLKALENNTSEYELIRVLFYRIFLFSNSYLNGKIPEYLIDTQAKLEVENIYSALAYLGGENGKKIAQLFNNKNKEILLQIGIEGHDNLKLNNEKKPFFTEDIITLYSDSDRKITKGDNFYIYDYIKDENSLESYIPINDGFSGEIFYENGKLKKYDRLTSLKNAGYVFIDSGVNAKNIPLTKRDNGSYGFDIVDNSKYVSNINNYTPNIQYEATLKQLERVSNQLQSRSINITDIGINTLNYPTIIQNIDGNEKYYAKNLKPHIQETYPVNDFNFLPYFYYQTDTDLGKIFKRDLTCGTYMVKLKFEGDENYKQRLLGGGLVSSQKEFLTLGNIKNGDLLLPYIGSTISTPVYSSGEGVRSWYLDNGYLYTKNNLLEGSNEDYFIPFIEFGSALRDNFIINSGPTTLVPNLYDNEIRNRTTNLLKVRPIKQSLFGSWLYNQQKHKEAKAILFLHTIPFNGVNMKNNNDIPNGYFFDKESDYFLTSTGVFNFDLDSSNMDGNGLWVEDKNSILAKTLFQSINGLIHVPKSWLLFIGGILWRMEQDEDPIIFKDIYSDNKFNTLINDTFLPKKDEYLFYFEKELTNNEKPWGMWFDGYSNPELKSGVIINKSYIPVDKTLRFLPKSIKEQIIKYFITWVNDSDNGFIKIQEELEIWDGLDKVDITNPIEKTEEYISKLQTFTNSVDLFFEPDIDNEIDKKSLRVDRINLNTLENIFGKNVKNNYDFVYVNNENVGQGKGEIGNVQLILKQNTEIQTILVNLFTEPVILKNNNPNIWNLASSKRDIIGLDINESLIAQGYNLNDDGSLKNGKSIKIRKTQFDSFIDSFLNHYKQLYNSFQTSEFVDNSEEKQRVFGTTDDDKIKLQIYRTLSSINDKWVNGSKTGCPTEVCGYNNSGDIEIRDKYRNDSGCPSLLDTFRFVDRAFRDIGDDFYLNLNYINEIITGNYNQSFFDVVNQILTNNNFNFIALPTFFNFNDIEELKTAFTPYSYKDTANTKGNGGPGFICVYVGQTSTNLDLGTESTYPDDGLSFRYDDNINDIIIQKEASDFTEDSKVGDLNVPVFAINYGQQNQNYFKSLKLDQREFTETMESLQVIEDISLGGDKSKATYAGNNLFNVYKTRSYSATVDMMGSAMIQPMMYFQLSNVPMFRGAYLIFKVNHSIKPHSMTTSFTGNRVKKTKTPLLDKATMYMNLIGLDGPTIPIDNRTPKNKLAPIVRTLVENGIVNGVPENRGNITFEPIDFSKLNRLWDSFGKKSNENEIGNLLISEAIEPLTKMLNDWFDWMVANEFSGFVINGVKKYAGITSIYRTIEKQRSLKGSQKKSSATPSTSYHGWGVAIDLQYYDKSGNSIPNKANNPEYFDVDKNPAIKWLYDNSYKYGWVIPTLLRDGKGTLEEHWHWEYHGTSAKCIIEKSPKIYGYKVDTTGEVFEFVKNPKTLNGEIAVYENCDYIRPNEGDGDETGENDMIAGIEKIPQEELTKYKNNSLTQLGNI